MFNKTESEKLLKWEKKDVTANVFTYIVNALLIMGLFLLFIYVNGGLDSLVGFLTDVKHIVQFVVFLFTVVGITAVYMFFSDRNYMKSASNSEMFFLIIEFSFVANFLVGKYINVYLRPIAVSSLIVLFLSNKRNAIFIGAVSSIIIFLTDIYSSSVSVSIIAYSSLVIGFSSSVIAVFTMD